MNSMQSVHPVALFLYYLVVIAICVFVSNPVLTVLSLLGSLLFFYTITEKISKKSEFGFLALFLIMVLLNPLFSHHGNTVLFLINRKPITLEAFLYGLNSSAMIISVLYWCRSFSGLMTEDKLLCLFGRLSPKLSLVLSMAIRYIPLYLTQLRKINNTQKALGLYKEDNIIDRIRGSLRVFSVLVTWALENGIITAESMSARGYGIRQRTQFSLFRFRKKDTFFLIMILLLGAVSFLNMALGNFSVTFYPDFEFSAPGALELTGYISYFILVLLPTILEKEEQLKWKYYVSKI